MSLNCTIYWIFPESLPEMEQRIYKEECQIGLKFCQTNGSWIWFFVFCVFIERPNLFHADAWYVTYLERAVSRTDATSLNKWLPVIFRIPNLNTSVNCQEGHWFKKRFLPTTTSGVLTFSKSIFSMTWRVTLKRQPTLAQAHRCVTSVQPSLECLCLNVQAV